VRKVKFRAGLFKINTHTPHSLFAYQWTQWGSATIWLIFRPLARAAKHQIHRAIVSAGRLAMRKNTAGELTIIILHSRMRLLRCIQNNAAFTPLGSVSDSAGVGFSSSFIILNTPKREKTKWSERNNLKIKNSPHSGFKKYHSSAPAFFYDVGTILQLKWATINRRVKRPGN
jgi:hypothetical protein